MQRNRLAGDLPASARVGRVSRGTTREPRGPSFLPPPAAPRGQTHRRLLHLHHFAEPAFGAVVVCGAATPDTMSGVDRKQPVTRCYRLLYLRGWLVENRIFSFFNQPPGATADSIET